MRSQAQAQAQAQTQALALAMGADTEQADRVQGGDGAADVVAVKQVHA